jgi:hypothetical protein
MALFAAGWCSPLYTARTRAFDEAYRLDDFDQLWFRLRRTYAFFDKKTTDWTCVRDTYRPLAQAAASRDAFLHVLEPTLESLYDAHAPQPKHPRLFLGRPQDSLRRVAR